MPEIKYHIFILILLSIGTTVAILALFGKVEMLILLLKLLTVAQLKSQTLILVCILSTPGAFWEFNDFKMVLTSLCVILEHHLAEGIKVELDCKLLFLWIFSILAWFLYLSKIEVKTLFALHNQIPSYTFSGLKPQDRSTMLM